MAITRLPEDFKEFLQLINSLQIEYMLVGGYAVAWHGYPRATGDMDLWVAMSPRNADLLVTALKRFGFAVPELRSDLFTKPEQVIRMGNPPFRIEIITSISGCNFADCRNRCVQATLDGTPVPIIGLGDLRTNKRAAGRHKDLDDLEHLPDK